MKQWKIVSLEEPPTKESFWGYDDFTESVYVCSWDGEHTNDSGEPFPKINEKGGNDYSITHWMEMEQPPASPNVKRYEDD
jgi:hypothetical protein